MAAITNSSTLSDVALRWLVVGADGLIGAALVAELERRGQPVVGTTRRPGSRHRLLDLAVDPGAWTLPAADIAVLCAAATRISDCEVAPDQSVRVNVAAPLALAQRIWAQGGFVVFLSSSAVFDGVTGVPRPDTPLAPTHAYGRHKAEAEAALLAAAGGRGLAIIRPTKVFAPDTPLLRGWRADLAAGRIIAPHAWRSMAPLHHEVATAGILAIAGEREAGIWHLSGAEDVDYAGFARRWATTCGYPASLIVPQTGPEAAPRARLDMTATTRRFGIIAPTLDATVASLAREMP